MLTMKTFLDNWDIKDRTYLLKSKDKPLTYRINTSRLTVFDESTKTNRGIRYAENQPSLFTNEQRGISKMSHVSFTDGVLHVPKTNPTLQILMSKLHPQAGTKWVELDNEKRAKDELAVMEKEMEATQLAASLDVEHLEAIMRTELGQGVKELSSRELKRDAYIFARKNPELFTELANDEDIKLRNLANRVVEEGYVNLTDDNTVFKWASNGKKIFTVPFDQHPYAAFAQFFKTDEGADVFTALMKKLD